MVDAREERCRALLPLVRAIARRIKRLVPSVDIDDLVGDGCVGLIRAVDSFDPDRGTSLQHYARQMISGAILNGVRRMDPVPERVRRKIRECERRRYEIACEREEIPNDADLERDCPGFLRASAVAHRVAPLSIDAPLPEGEIFRQDPATDPATVVVESAVHVELHRGIAKLPERQRDLVIHHYFARQSLREIGVAWSITPQRASQLHVAAIERLRKEYRVTAG